MKDTKSDIRLCPTGIANSRIINHRRTPHAQIEILLKVPVDVSYDRVVIFKSAIEAYIKARPREWLHLVAFRATNVTTDRGFIEYKVVTLNRESWQSMGAIHESRANLTSYCLEVSFS